MGILTFASDSVAGGLRSSTADQCKAMGSRAIQISMSIAVLLLTSTRGFSPMLGTERATMYSPARSIRHLQDSSERARHHQLHRRTSGPHIALCATDDDGTGESRQTEPEKKRAMGHFGGRSRRRRRLSSDRKEDMFVFPRWSWAAVPILVVLLFVKTLFGSGENNPSFVYYERSTFESRVYRGDGRVDVSRKATVRSNVPSLLEGKQLQQQQRLSSPDSSSSSYLLRESPDDRFEREIRSLVNDFQRTMYSDFL